MRSSTACGLPFTLNLEVPCWLVQGASVVFLPDRLALVIEGRTVLIGYEEVQLTHDAEDVIEEGHVPTEATVLGTQWRHMTRSGAPDLRFRDNPARSLVRYGRFHLQAGASFALIVRTSRLAAASELCSALHHALQGHPSVRGARPSLPIAHPPSFPATSAPLVPIVSQPLQHAVPQSASRTSVAPAVAPPSRPSASPPPVPLRSLVATAAIPAMPPPSASALAPARVEPPPIPSAARPVLAEVVVTARKPPESPGRTQPQAAMLAPQAGNARGIVELSFGSDDDEPPTVAPPVLATAFALPPRAPSTSDLPARWVKPGESVEVHGRTIRGGLLYVGERLAGKYGQSEPSLLRPSLPVATDLDWEGVSIGYWPSYAALGREQRATYLEWLARGRRDPRAGISYVFVFFYGLERRAFADPDRTDEDLTLLRDEVLALREVYGHNRSFERYSSSFLDVLDLWIGGRRCAPTSVELAGDPLPLWLRVELSRHAQEGAPLDATWAMAWHDAARPKASPTVRTRCDTEVRSLFERLYRERFGAGIVPSRGRARLKAEYLAASGGLERPITISIDGLTEVSGGASASRNLDGIGELLQRCVDELEPYSRWLGRNPDGRGSLAALAYLPQALSSEGHSDAQRKLARELDGLLGEHSRTVLRGRAIIERLGTAKGPKLSKAEVTTSLQLLEKVGFGVEPDVRFRGASLTFECDVVLFRLPPGSPSSPSASYEAGTLFAQLAAVMSTADGTISDDERRHTERHIEQALKLDAGERARLAAHLDLLLLAPPTAASIKKRLANIPESARESLATFLIGVAGADGHIDPAEIKLLQKLYPLLGLGAELVFTHLHAMAVVTPSTPPPRGAARRSSTPPAPRETSQRGAVELDMARVQATLAQTNAVSALLGSIFEESEAPEALPPTAPTQRSVAGLDAAHSGLLLTLARAPSWTRAEYEQEVVRWGLLPDGALEMINERAFDRCGAALCEGDDPITVDAQLAREMIDA